MFEIKISGDGASFTSSKSFVILSYGFIDEGQKVITADGRFTKTLFSFQFVPSNAMLLHCERPVVVCCFTVIVAVVDAAAVLQ